MIQLICVKFPKKELKTKERFTDGSLNRFHLFTIINTAKLSRCQCYIKLNIQDTTIGIKQFKKKNSKLPKTTWWLLFVMVYATCTVHTPYQWSFRWFVNMCMWLPSFVNHNFSVYCIQQIAFTLLLIKVIWNFKRYQSQMGQIIWKIHCLNNFWLHANISLLFVRKNLLDLKILHLPIILYV